MPESGVDVKSEITTRPRWETKPLEKAELKESHLILGEFSAKPNRQATEEASFVVGVGKEDNVLEVLRAGVGVAVPWEEVLASPGRGEVTRILKDKLTQGGSERVLKSLAEGGTKVTVTKEEIFKPEVWPIPADPDEHITTKPDGTGVDTLGMTWTADRIAQVRKVWATKNKNLA